MTDNFMTDWLDLSVEVDDTFFAKAKKAILDPENRKAVVKYAGDNWVSRDGFVSSMLDRISTLSRDAWKAKTYGTRMATDEDVEKALVADMDDAFGALENDTSEDAFREFGAILALLWLIEYPSDFDQSDDSPTYGSWVTDEMVEHLRGNSSVSEFCTVLDKDEVKARFGAHMIDFDRRRREFKVDLGKYCSADFQDRARIEKICELFREKVEKVFNGLEEEQVRVIANHATSDRAKDGAVNEELDDFREEAAQQLTAAAFTPLWAEASHEAM